MLIVHESNYLGLKPCRGGTGRPDLSHARSYGDPTITVNSPSLAVTSPPPPPILFASGKTRAQPTSHAQDDAN